MKDLSLKWWKCSERFEIQGCFLGWSIKKGIQTGDLGDFHGIRWQTLYKIRKVVFFVFFFTPGSHFKSNHLALWALELTHKWDTNMMLRSAKRDVLTQTEQTHTWMWAWRLLARPRVSAAVCGSTCCLFALPPTGNTCQNGLMPALVRPAMPAVQTSLGMKQFLPFPLDTSSAVRLFPGFNAVSLSCVTWSDRTTPAEVVLTDGHCFKCCVFHLLQFALLFTSEQYSYLQTSLSKAVISDPERHAVSSFKPRGSEVWPFLLYETLSHPPSPVKIMLLKR